MSESKFTPGPWRVVSEWIDDGDGSEVEIYSVSGPNPDDLILDQPIDLADAKLIAAAPDMIAALERAALQFRYYEEAHREKGTDDSMRKAEVNAGLAYDIEQVIAKATA